jgi:hypothetical protein
MIPGRRGQATSASPPPTRWFQHIKARDLGGLKGWASTSVPVSSFYRPPSLISTKNHLPTFTLTTPAMTTPFFNSFNPSSSTSQVPFDIASVMQGLAHSDLPSLINDILGNLASAAQPQPQGEASADASASKTEGPVLTKTMIPRFVLSFPGSVITR